jgi:hypothetical protein
VSVEVRQWGRACFAAYVFDDGDQHGSYVGSERTRTLALEVGEQALRDRAAGLRTAGITDESPSLVPLDSRSDPVESDGPARVVPLAGPDPDPASPGSEPGMSMPITPDALARPTGVAWWVGGA